VLVLLNTGDEARTCTVAGLDATAGEVVAATSERRGRVSLSGLLLDALEGVALRL
jgi:hypothetical protein